MEKEQKNSAFCIEISISVEMALLEESSTTVYKNV